MAIKLNHTIIPARQKRDAAAEFARLFGVESDHEDGWFVHVKTSPDLTFLFEQMDDFEPHHYAFHVSDKEFDAILARVRDVGLEYGSDPGDRHNGKLNNWGGGRGVYFTTMDGHVLELMTVPQ